MTGENCKVVGESHRRNWNYQQDRGRFLPGVTELRYDEGAGVNWIAWREGTWLEWGFQASKKVGSAAAEGSRMRVEAAGAAEVGRSQIVQDLCQLCEFDRVLTLQNRRMKLRENEGRASGHTASWCPRWGWNDISPLLEPRFVSVAPNDDNPTLTHCPVDFSPDDPLKATLLPGSRF